MAKPDMRLAVVHLQTFNEKVTLCALSLCLSILQEQSIVRTLNDKCHFAYDSKHIFSRYGHHASDKQAYKSLEQPRRFHKAWISRFGL